MIIRMFTSFLVGISLLASIVLNAADDIIYHGIRPSFVVNVRTETGGSRFLSIKLDISSRSEAVIDAVKDNKLLIRDRLTAYFIAQEEESLKTMADKESFRQNTVKALNQALIESVGFSGVENVLFTEFILE